MKPDDNVPDSQRAQLEQLAEQKLRPLESRFVDGIADYRDRLLKRNNTPGFDVARKLHTFVLRWLLLNRADVDPTKPDASDKR